MLPYVIILLFLSTVSSTAGAVLSQIDARLKQDADGVIFYNRPGNWWQMSRVTILLILGVLLGAAASVLAFLV